jgi:hypothetical protein
LDFGLGTFTIGFETTLGSGFFIAGFAVGGFTPIVDGAFPIKDVVFDDVNVLVGVAVGFEIVDLFATDLFNSVDFVIDVAFIAVGRFNLGVEFPKLDLVKEVFGIVSLDPAVDLFS